MKNVDFEELYMKQATISFTDPEGNFWLGKVMDYTPDHDNEDGVETFAIEVKYTSKDGKLLTPGYGFGTNEVSNVQQVYAVKPSETTKQTAAA